MWSHCITLLAGLGIGVFVARSYWGYNYKKEYAAWWSHYKAQVNYNQQLVEELQAADPGYLDRTWEKGPVEENDPRIVTSWTGLRIHKED